MRLAIALLAILLATSAVILGLPRINAESESASVLRPIIAQLVANPDAFAGRTIEIYGLVIEGDAKNEFLLQDVSQRPLRVVNNARLTVAVGDQLTVVGKFNAGPRSIFVTAERLIPTKVTGGGGCC
ncbi:MAG: hypothetical protein WD871_15335 [Xanthobacteraceae bacterium]